jgi:hypothetical protein
MEKIHQTVFINSPREKVWKTMLADATYREWTSAFNPGSYYKGDWSEGSKILFLGPNPDGSGEGGMVSHIEVARPYEFISIHHDGLYKGGVEDTTSDEVKGWAGAYENYTFNEKDGGTELVIDMVIMLCEKDFMDKAWANALLLLKEIAER